MIANYLISLVEYMYIYITCGRLGPGVQGRLKRDACGFDPHSREWIIIFSYFRFFALAQRQEPGVEFRHSTRIASKNLAESGVRSVLSLRFLWLLYCVRDRAWSFKKYHHKSIISDHCSSTAGTSRAPTSACMPRSRALALRTSTSLVRSSPCSRILISCM